MLCKYLMTINICVLYLKLLKHAEKTSYYEVELIMHIMSCGWKRESERVEIFAAEHILYMRRENVVCDGSNSHALHTTHITLIAKMRVHSEPTGHCFQFAADFPSILNRQNGENMHMCVF